ncbi:MAG: protein kinase domain-containing protein [Myxococcota bacterium]
MSNDVRELIGQTFVGRYEIVSRLGAGGMGTVYKAKHLAMEREVAIKVLNSHLVNDDASRKRFVREMKATSAIESPYTVSVHDYGTTEAGEAFLVMEFLQGLTLKQILRRDGALSLDRLLTITRHVASALGSAHTCDIIHRDIKPENIILLDTFDGGEWTKVLDFGIAQIGLDDANTSPDQLTAAGTVLGTPSYMSPERARGEAFDHRSDLYALGVLMYVMATGKTPYESKEPMGVLFKHITDPIPTLKEKSDADHPLWLEELIHTLMAKEADDRPSTAAEFLALLDDAVSDNTPTKRRESLITPDNPGAENPNDAPTQMLPEAKPPAPKDPSTETERVGLQQGTAKVEVQPGAPQPRGGMKWLLALLFVGIVAGGLMLFGPPMDAPPAEQTPAAKATASSTANATVEEAAEETTKGGAKEPAKVDNEGPPTRRLAAVLFTDMVGYSKLMRVDEAESLEKLRTHDTLLEAAFSAQSGRIIKRLGDGFMVEFGSSVEAVKAALAGQKALATHNTGKSESGSIMVRMGVDVGDVVVRTSDLFGETVNVASQIRRMAPPGGVAVTDTVLTDVRGKLKAAGKSLAPTRLKGRTAATTVHILEGADKILNEVSPAPEGPQGGAMGGGPAHANSASSSAAAERLKAAERLLKKAPAKALKAAMAILADHPGDGPTMLLGARARRALKQNGGALSALEACRSAQPGYVPCFFELGRTKEILGRRDEAHAIYEALIKAHPGSVEALEARKRLKR